MNESNEGRGPFAWPGPDLIGPLRSIGVRSTTGAEWCQHLCEGYRWMDTLCPRGDGRLGLVLSTC